MHKIDIPRYMVERVTALRGKEHCFEDFDPARTALLVVDMQNAYMMPGVAHALCEPAHEIVPNINRLARAVRAAGAPVVWIHAVYEEETLRSWSVAYEMAGAEGTKRRISALSRGSKGYELWPGLEALPQDLHVEAVLRRRGIEWLLIAGTVTNVCCESTARDAMMRNFRVIMVTDANAAFTDEEHNAALTSFYLVFGDIMPADMVIERLARNRRGAAAE
jgi:ureidoacrylate peracid hydrolase